MSYNTSSMWCQMTHDDNWVNGFWNSLWYTSDLDYKHVSGMNYASKLKFYCIWKRTFLGALVAQLVGGPTLGFGSGHDLTVREFEPHSNYAGCGACLGFSFSLPPTLSKNKQINLKIGNDIY